ncbi:hypothetical protein [Ammoniphilus sp. 3BR4]|uniref:hypothetical protein n=1 Tax=Ammoniphilus sp. 3BR4 TaxID=3158265 RepID=UPI00346691FF
MNKGGVIDEHYGRNAFCTFRAGQDPNNNDREKKERKKREDVNCFKEPKKWIVKMLWVLDPKKNQFANNRFFCFAIHCSKMKGVPFMSQSYVVYAK